MPERPTHYMIRALGQKRGPGRLRSTVQPVNQSIMTKSNESPIKTGHLSLGELQLAALCIVTHQRAGTMDSCLGLSQTLPYTSFPLSDSFLFVNIFTVTNVQTIYSQQSSNTFSWPHGIQDLSSPPGIEPCPLHWELRVLTTGLPGKSLKHKILKHKMSLELQLKF